MYTAHVSSLDSSTDQFLLVKNFLKRSVKVIRILPPLLLLKQLLVYFMGNAILDDAFVFVCEGLLLGDGPPRVKTLLVADAALAHVEVCVATHIDI